MWILITTRLANCKSIENYINKIVTTAFKLYNIGLTVSCEWVGMILLPGLPDKYKTMIMGIEMSVIKITTDFVKTKWMQDVSVEISENNTMALYGNKYRRA